MVGGLLTLGALQRVWLACFAPSLRRGGAVGHKGGRSFRAGRAELAPLGRRLAGRGNRSCFLGSAGALRGRRSSAAGAPAQLPGSDGHKEARPPVTPNNRHPNPGKPESRLPGCGRRQRAPSCPGDDHREGPAALLPLPGLQRRWRRPPASPRPSTCGGATWRAAMPRRARSGGGRRRRRRRRAGE